MKIVYFAMQSMRNIKKRGRHVQNCSNRVNFVCNLLFVLFSIRYLLERFVYLQISQISVPMMIPTLNAC